MNAPEPTVADVRRYEERIELLRIAKQRVIDDHAAGRIVDPETLESCRAFVRQNPPLGRPLSTGEPG